MDDEKPEITKLTPNGTLYTRSDRPGVKFINLDDGIWEAKNEKRAAEAAAQEQEADEA
mgnify:CR=1 FL=1